jgi:hypothetical protein
MGVDERILRELKGAGSGYGPVAGFLNTEFLQDKVFLDRLNNHCFQIMHHEYRSFYSHITGRFSLVPCGIYCRCIWNWAPCREVKMFSYHCPQTRSRCCTRTRYLCVCAVDPVFWTANRVVLQVVTNVSEVVIIFFRNTTNHLQDHTASQARRPQSIFSPPLKTRISTKVMSGREAAQFIFNLDSRSCWRSDLAGGEPRFSLGLNVLKFYKQIISDVSPFLSRQWKATEATSVSIRSELFTGDIGLHEAGHSGRAVWGVGLGPLVAGIVGSNPAQGIDVCPRLSVLCCLV